MYRNTINSDEDDKKLEGDTVDIGQGLCTYVSVKQSKSYAKNKRRKEGSHVVDIGDGNSMMVVNDAGAADQQVKAQDEEPDFMKYIENMNINQVNQNYVKGQSLKE